MAPLSVAAVLGVVFCGVSFLMILVLVVRTLIWGDPVAGWPSMVCVILFMGGIQLLCMGIMGEYLSKTYLESKHRPIYIVRSSSYENSRKQGESRITYLLSCLLLAGITVAACWFFAGRYGVFGANMDWISQHSVFPEYFRQQFYQTGQFFPEFAANIGGGQNIYHFSYYGLYNPVVLVAYLLPFVKMSDYLMAAGVVCLVASVCLMYVWLKRRGFSAEICMGISLLFLLAGPMIYQSCHQIMFVQYMPFLMLALLGIDRYWEKGKTGLYTLGVFLMILTSFTSVSPEWRDLYCMAGIGARRNYRWKGDTFLCTDGSGGDLRRCPAGADGLCTASEKRQFPKRVLPIC